MESTALHYRFLLVLYWYAEFFIVVAQLATCRLSLYDRAQFLSILLLGSLNRNCTLVCSILRLVIDIRRPNEVRPWRVSGVMICSGFMSTMFSSVLAASLVADVNHRNESSSSAYHRKGTVRHFAFPNLVGIAMIPFDMLPISSIFAST